MTLTASRVTLLLPRPGVKPTPASAEVSPGPWWLPVHAQWWTGTTWSTVNLRALPPEARGSAYDAITAAEIYGISLVDVRGDAYAVVIDVDSKDLALLRYIRRILPPSPGIICTDTGGRGFRAWLFLSAPIPHERVRPFVDAVLAAVQRAFGPGAPVEVFPDRTGSHCVRWFGLPHPETGRPERLLDPETLTPSSEDPATILRAIARGQARYSLHLVNPYRVEARLATLRRIPRTRRLALVVTNDPEVSLGGEATRPPAGPPSILDLLVRDERFVRAVANITGTEFVAPKKPARCPLHPPDRRPSGAWLKSQDGTYIFFCFHNGRPYGLPDLLATHQNGRLTEPRGLERKDYILRAAHAVGLLQQLTEEVLQRNTAILREALGGKRILSTDSREDSLPAEVNLLLRIWYELAGYFRANAQAGRCTALAPVEALARKAGTNNRLACAAANFVCALGFASKVRAGHKGRAQVLVLCSPSPDEVKRRLRLLGTDWRSCSRARVAATLGEAEAARIFLRRPTKTPVSAG